MVLPAWAEDAAHFVGTLRKVLESDYVSTRLDDWVDLVFGCTLLSSSLYLSSSLLYSHLTTPVHGLRFVPPDPPCWPTYRSTVLSLGASSKGQPARRPTIPLMCVDCKGIARGKDTAGELWAAWCLGRSMAYLHVEPPLVQRSPDGKA